MLDNGPRDMAKIPPDLYVFGSDITEYCTIPDYVETVLEVCLVDLNEATYICSMTPSAFCYHLYFTAIFKETATEDQIENWHNEMLEWEREDDYSDFSQVERICKAGGEWVYRPTPYTPEEIADFEDYRAMIEDAREGYTANCMI
jgi:hypothetical protein